jgi:all-trans-nonaprenyl-diphosphate synthase
MEMALYTLLGIAIGYTVLVLFKRMNGMNEFSKIKRDLSLFVSRDKRLHALFPPQYVSVRKGEVHSYSQTINMSWQSVSEARLVEVKTGIESRIERAALAAPSYAAALRYAFAKSGKMIRSRIVILLGTCLDVTDWPRLVLLAQAVEIEHCASLLHDDVVDDADTRRGIESHRKKFGDRAAVLTGDNLISLLVDVLTDIGDMKVTETISGSIEALVIGELVQLMHPSSDLQRDKLNERLSQLVPTQTTDPFLLSQMYVYLRKSFFKTASLFAALARCVGIIGRLDAEAIDSLGSFGFFFGLAFQLVDDILDVEPSCEEELGKPSGGSDVKNGTITLPVLLAADNGLFDLERIEMMKMIKRRFKLGGDPERALTILGKSNAVERSRHMVTMYLGRARADLLEVLKDKDRIEVIDGLLRDYGSRRS